MTTEVHIPPEVRSAEGTEEIPIRTQAAGGIHLLDIILILAEQWVFILGVMFVVTLVGVVIAFVLPVRYTAEVTLMPPQQQGSSLSSAIASEFGGLSSMASLTGGSLGIKNQNDMYVGMLKSRVVEDALIRQFNLSDEYHRHYLSDTRKVFEKRAGVEGGLKDGLIHISFEDGNPQRAAQIANAYVDQFRTLSQHLAITEAGQRRLFLEQQVNQTKAQLVNAEEAMKETQQKTGLIELDSQARELIQSAAYLRAQIAAKQVQIEGMRSYATDQNAGVAQAEQELSGLRAQMEKLTGSKDIDGMIVPKGQVTEAGLEYLRKMRDVKYFEAEFGLLSRQLELARLDEAKEGATIQVLDPAYAPDKRSFPKRSLLILAAAAAGLFLAVLFALIRGQLARMSEDPLTYTKFTLIKSALRRRRATSL
jgi:uncharacterized protein involved in exopolysaccharide biosynthesis